MKPEGRKGKRPLFAEENYEEKSEEDIIDIDDSDEENGSTPKEMRVKRPLFSEEISEKKSEDVTEPNDLPIGTCFFYFSQFRLLPFFRANFIMLWAIPTVSSFHLYSSGISINLTTSFEKCKISLPVFFHSLKGLLSVFLFEGAEKAGTAEMEKEKMPEAPVPKRSRVKVCATKGCPSLCSSKSTSPKSLPSNPSNVNPVQTNQKYNGENPESEQRKDIPEQASSQQVDEVSPSSLLGEPSLDSCLEFAFKTLTEDILVLDKDEEV